MARRGRRQLVMLPRDPERAYLYWEWPDDLIGEEAGEVAVSVKTPDGSWRRIKSFAVDETLGGRFIDFERPGAIHRAELRWRDQCEVSAPLAAPRRNPGDGAPVFVRLRFSAKGLQQMPTEYEHPVQGTFPVASVEAPSSSSWR